MRGRALPRLRPLLAGLVLAIGLPLLAAADARAADCRPLAAQAETEFGVPPGILQAIALVESGMAGRAWAWTINANGRPFYLRTHDDAVVVAEAAARHFGTSVAVGCMQVYLRWHGDNFMDLRAMLEPANNVRYAAAYLVALRRDHETWEAAVRHYHASNRAAQRDYLCRVLTQRAALGYQPVTPAMRQQCAAHAALARTTAAKEGEG